MATTEKDGAGIGFEEVLWATADKLRGTVDAAEYKHVVLGFLFLKYISDAFDSRREALKAELEKEGIPAKQIEPLLESRDEYTAERVFWVPQAARWENLRAKGRDPNIATLIDDAILAIERDNPKLKGKLPRDYARRGIPPEKLGGLIDLISDIGFKGDRAKARDTLGRVYEYFLGKFAAAEGKLGGEFYTPRGVVRLLVEMLEPYSGRVYDPCGGSGGMFVQSEKFVQAHGGQQTDISIFGQESNPMTWRLAHMNLAIRGIEANLGNQHADTFLHDLHPDLKADYTLANPPFNVSDWSGQLLRGDKRWKYGDPPIGNANYAWIQHFIHHMAPPNGHGGGVAGFVMANASLASEPGIEANIRTRIIKDNLVDCIVTLPDRLFYSTPIPVSLWFLSRSKNQRSHGESKNCVLFIDAGSMGVMPTRTSRELTDDEISKIVGIYRSWKTNDVAYVDEPGLCRSVKVSEIAEKEYSLHPAAYIEVAVPSDEATSTELKIGLRTICKANKDIGEQVAMTSGVLRDLFASNILAPEEFSRLEWNEFRIGDVLERSNERLGKRPEPEILTCTEQAGLILQRERFSKRVATENVTKYKYVRRTDIVYNPYLLWAGSIDQCWIVDHGITSPAYEVFRVQEGFDPYIVGFALTTNRMIATYNGISVGTVTRRRRAAPERFLELQVTLPSIDNQKRLSPILTKQRIFVLLVAILNETQPQLLATRQD